MASFPHGYQSTGLCACCNKYGDFSSIKRFVYGGMDGAVDWECFSSGGSTAARVGDGPDIERSLWFFGGQELYDLCQECHEKGRKDK